MDNKALLEQIGKLIDAKLDEKLEPIKTDVSSIKKDMATKADLDQLTEDMADFFNKTWVEMGESNERITRLEDHAGLPHKN